MSFTTSWISLAGIQGFERFKAANLLGTAYTPFKLNAQIAYDYNPSPQQATLITPVDNIGPVYGNGGVYGSGGNYSGTSGSVFTARLFPENQKCQTFQLQVNEIYDPSYNIAAGQGLDLSGLLLLVGVKRGSRTQSAAKSFG
jgi:hypothetical protein